MRLRYPALFTCLAVLPACGSRSSLLLAPFATGGAGASTTETTSTAETTADAGPVAPPCAWHLVPGAPIALTDPGIDNVGGGYDLDSEGTQAVEGNRIFISTRDGLETVDPTPHWRMRVVSDDLATIGPSQVLLDHGPDGANPMSVASGFGHRGAIALDTDAGCRFVAIADDGSPAAPPVPIGSHDDCFWLRATPDGFTLFTRPDWTALSFFTLDVSGHVVATKVGDVGPPNFELPTAHARLPDGSTLIAWPTFAAAMNLQRWSATGDALTEPTALFAMPPLAAVAMTVIGSTVLVAWAPYSGDVGAVLVQPIDGDGQALAPATEISPADGSPVVYFDIGAAGGDALVAWTKGKAFTSVLTVQPVTAIGAAKGGPIVVPATPHVGAVRIGGTPIGAILGFDGMQPGGHTQAFVTRLRCDSE